MNLLLQATMLTILTVDAWATKTDFGVYALPALPAMGPAGSKVVDPVFGTTIMRLTDGADGNNGAGTLYSYYPSFNKDSTFVIANFLTGGSHIKIYPFNAANFTAGTGYRINNPPSGLQQYNMTWSGTDPNVLYGVGQHSIWAVDVVTQAKTLIKDLSAWGEGGYITQMLKSIDDNAFAASLVNGAGSTVGYIHYKRATDQVTKTLVSNIDEVMVDKSGRYLMVVFNDGNTQVWDYQSLPPTLKGAMSGVWHRDAGQGSMISAHSGNSMGFRRLATPSAVTVNLAGYIGFATQQDHISFQTDNETWALLSRYYNNSSGGPVIKAFDNEVFQFTTDGSNQVRRICHHRMVGNDYSSTPKANISRDGRFIAFTSNWGVLGGRRDLYIAQISPAPGDPVADSTPPATSITAPAQGATVSGTITVSASATDISGVAGVQFKIDGANLGAEDTTSPYSVSFNTQLVANSAHIITAVARDSVGNSTSAARNITVSNANPPPSLRISATVGCAPNCPLNGTTTPVNVTVLSGTPTSMEFSRDGGPMFLTCPSGAQCHAAPSWGFTWCISSSCWGGVSGAHTLFITARDASGQTASTSVTVNVLDSPATSIFDVNQDGTVNVVDVQVATNQALGLSACSSGDTNGDGLCNVSDVQRVVNASLGV